MADKKKKNEAASKQKIASNKNRQKLAKTVQTSIPYKRVYDDTRTNGGIIETEDGVFTKSYYLYDANYSDAGDDRQEEILETFEKILSTFSYDVTYQITVNNRTLDQEAFNKRVLMPYQSDKYDKWRIEHNNIILEKMQEGKNNLKAEKYLTVAVKAADIHEAMTKFSGIEKNVNQKFKKINQEGIKAISLKDRLGIMHDIYNNGKEDEFDRIFDMNAIIAQGITTKDIIGPSYFDFKPKGKVDRMMIGDTYARALFLKSIPSTLTSTLIESLTSISANVVVSVFYDAQPQDKAVAFASSQVTNIGGMVVKAQKNLSKTGADPSLISSKLDTAHRDAKELLDDLTNANQNLFHVSLVAVVFAQNEDDLAFYTKQLQTKAKEHICAMEVLSTCQEQGLDSVLPLAHNYTKNHRVMTSETASALQPFSSQELQHKGGLYYGLNQSSKNLIMYNKAIGNNQNGVILGPPGTGKSFAAKMEIYQTFLNTKDQIFIIDPEQEYFVLAKAFDGVVLPIEPGGEVHINPLDLDITKDADDPDPVSQKVDFIISVIETMLGGRAQLNGYLRGIIDSTLQELYAPYLKYLRDKNIAIDTDMCPTLENLYNALRARKEPESKNLAASIKMYCVGTLNLFAYHTNVDAENRFVVYDTKNIGVNLQELGMQICLNDIWNRMIANKKKARRTRFFIDEFYLLLRQPSAAAYLQMIWKRARKWLGMPVGITQNCSDLLASQEGNTILQTSDFAILLSQAPLDRAKLSEMYNINEELQEYITNGNSGEGLIKTSRTIIPFENQISPKSPIYKLISTKAADAENISSLF